jgi:cyclohexanecarboxylate-CoA ligase
MDQLFLDQGRLEQEKRRGLWPGKVITDYLDRWVLEKPEALALVSWREEAQSCVRLTYRELAERAASASRALSLAGVARGEVVSFQLPNCWQFVAAHLACVRLGAVSNPLMPIFRQRELAFMLRHGDARVLIAPARFRGFDHGELARQLARELPGLVRVLLTDDDSADSFEAALGASEDAACARGARLEPNDVMQLLFTSGTTGNPRACTPRTPCSAPCAITPNACRSARGVIFMPSPLNHQLGFCYGLQMALMQVSLCPHRRVIPSARWAVTSMATFTFGATPSSLILRRCPTSAAPTATLVYSRARRADPARSGGRRARGSPGRDLLG